jgi:hypothetical protein
MTYTFTAYNKSESTINKGRQWLLVMNAVAIGLLGFSLPRNAFISILFLFMVSVGTIATVFFLWKKISTIKWSFYALLLAAILVWVFCLNALFMGLILLILAALNYFFIGQDQLVTLSQTTVLLQPLPFTHQHAWGEFSNIILRDGLLTLDFANNKLVQLEIDKIVPNDSEAAINDWLQKQLQTQA